MFALRTLRAQLENFRILSLRCADVVYNKRLKANGEMEKALPHGKRGSLVPACLLAFLPSAFPPARRNAGPSRKASSFEAQFHFWRDRATEREREVGAEAAAVVAVALALAEAEAAIVRCARFSYPSCLCVCVDLSQEA